MAAARTDFWELERRNRRETAILVVVFIALFTALGLGLDFRFHDLAIVDGSLTGFPLLTLIALGFGIFQSLLSYYGGTSLVLASVLGHEMAHVRDYDIRTMMMIAVLVAGIAMLADFVYRSMWYTGGVGGGGDRRSGGRDDDNSSGNAGALIG